jgi:hypothetical protein
MSKRSDSRSTQPADEEPRREAAEDLRENARSTRIQDEPESTIGRKPMEPHHPPPGERPA